MTVANYDIILATRKYIDNKVFWVSSRLVRTRPDVHHSVWKQYKIDVAATDDEEMI